MEAIKAEGCSVDVFVYASLGDEDLLEEQVGVFKAVLQSMRVCLVESPLHAE